MNPYRIDQPSLIAFSGGRTSGFMLRRIIEAFGGTLPDDVIVTFCNTGLEHPKTLDFVKKCGDEWSVPIVWIEYRAGPGGTKEAQVHECVTVDYRTASRNGEPFWQLCDQRKTLPNPIARFCTAELKIRTMHRYINRNIGWEDWTDQVGLRYDEPKRVHGIHEVGGVTVNCPMYKAKHTIEDVNQFWDAQPFKLEIPQHQGNCQGCFLKSRWRLEQVARETPEAFDWWIAAERQAAGWRAEGRPTNAVFRNDRASYRIQLEQAKQPTLFEGCDIDDTIPCSCTD